MIGRLFYVDKIIWICFVHNFTLLRAHFLLLPGEQSIWEAVVAPQKAFLFSVINRDSGLIILDLTL